MFKRFFPAEMADSVYSITYDNFWDKGIRGVIFDIDNTLATFDVARPDDRVLQLLDELTKKGFAVAFLSNNKKGRVVKFSEGLPYPYIWKARKPRLKGIRRILDMLKLSPEQVILVGDQIFTDCWVGQRAGIYTILTKPIALRDEWQVRLKRYPERLVLRRYARRHKND